MFANGTHMGIVNDAGIAALGIKNGQEKLPHGGNIQLDKNGVPDGVLTDCMDDVPVAPSQDLVYKAYTTQIQDLWNKFGFTAMMDITPASVMPFLQHLSVVYRPNIRYYFSVWEEPNGRGIPQDLSVFEMPRESMGDYYRFTGIKAWVDGENDCRTGLMYGEYMGHQATDPEGNRGSQIMDVNSCYQFAKIAEDNGKIVSFHCSGDRAMDIGMDAFEEITRTDPHPSIMRSEHFGMFQLYPYQLAKARELFAHNFKVCVQPLWFRRLAAEDYADSGSDRAKTGFQFKTIVDAGLEPAAGTDMTGIYMDNMSPFEAIYGEVTRQSNMGLLQPDQSISVTDALKMFTIWAAKSLGQEKDKGSVEIGKLGDLTVLSDDIFTIAKEKILNVNAYQTIVGGRIVYKAVSAR